ncbi:uncharacterized protein LAESUDRAFT_732080 [Laetiporus sulphureus 93-53]|uniref:Uncharacterized protein n=1 Tax=Laetiporus sulphureus 93-53 TaxID=1314785 RepID=A0A165BBA5_9APHY|nr:uncharacterized protein LAESUDRAFT_732080 [Laetiporus sulphureus 93-53]KZT00665.1 hypothetical protein LAESUDRAFT_732080 [Laetiporus sulphureus 93-53]
MPLITVSLDAFLAASIAIGVSSLYLIRRNQPPSPPHTPYRAALTLLVLLHTLYILYTVLLRWPPNLFSALHLPLTAPTEGIRHMILTRGGLPAGAQLPKPLEALLARLASFEMRTLYVRFGQEVVQNCEHCKTFDEYALFAVSNALLDYIREAVVLGLLTANGSGRERWRTHAVGALVCAAVLEGYFIAAAPVQIPRNGAGVFMWHDNFWAIRHLLFLLLPLLTHSLPGARPRPAPLAEARTTLEQTMARLAVLRYTHGAVMRDPVLRAAASEWWERQRVEGEWARADEGVRRVADRLGRSFAEAGAGGSGEGRLKVMAREVVARLVAGMTAAPP